MEDMGYTFKYVVTLCGGSAPIDEILDYAKAARAKALLRNSRIGMMGFRDMKLHATLYDGVSLRSIIGPDVEFFEMLEMQQIIEGLKEDDIMQVKDRLLRRWNFVSKPADDTLQNAVKLYLAVSRKVKERGYEAISLIDVDGVKKLMKFAPAGVFMLLHDEDDICTIPENDTLGSVSQLITRYLTGQVGAYLEFYEFMKDGVLMGVPDYVPSEIVDGCVTVMPTSFGQFGEGLLNVSQLRTGRVTLARLSYSGKNYCMHVVTGEAKLPRKWEEAGWQPPAPQLPSLEVILDKPVKDFMRKVLGQHYIISYGDNARVFEDLCSIMGVEVV